MLCKSKFSTLEHFYKLYWTIFSVKVIDEDYSMCIPKNTSHNFPSRLLRFRTLWCTFIRFNPLFLPFTWFRTIVVDPCFTHRHKSMQKLFQIAVKIGQILLRSSHTNAFLVNCEQSRPPTCTELSYGQMRRLEQKESKFFVAIEKWNIKTIGAKRVWRPRDITQILNKMNC